MADNDPRPEWWRKNDHLRAEMDLPKYSPPRFEDDGLAHEVTSSIERNHDCRIRFVGVNTTYPEEWEVRIDSQPAFFIGRYRDEEGNTVYEITSEAFREQVDNYLKDDK